MRLIDAEKISNYIKSEINPYGKPFKGNAYEFGLKLMKYLKNAGVDYDVDKVLKQLEEAKSMVPVNRLLDDITKDKPKELGQLIAYNKSIKIVKAGGINNNSKTSD